MNGSPETQQARRGAGSSPRAVVASGSFWGLIVGGIGGALLTLCVQWGLGTTQLPRGVDDHDLSPAVSGARSSPTDAIGEDATAVELRRIRISLDELAEQVAELQRVERSRRGGDRVAVGPRGSVVVDVESLVDAMDELEHRKLEAMSDDELLRSAREIQERGGGTVVPIRRLEALLGRSLSTEQRVEAMTQLAIMRRIQGTPEGLESSERSLQEIISRHGADSRHGLQATYQLIWTVSARQEPARGLELARRYAQSPLATLAERQQGRWAVAIMLQQIGDSVRARSEFEQLLREVDGQPQRQALADDIRRRLAGF